MPCRRQHLFELRRGPADPQNLENSSYGILTSCNFGVAEFMALCQVVLIIIVDAFFLSTLYWKCIGALQL